MASSVQIGAYYYPGWHRCSVRDAPFPRNWSEWDLVYSAKPYFGGHEQPNLPVWGRLDESCPQVFDLKIRVAKEHKLDLFVFAFYWSHGKRLLQNALDQGFLGSGLNSELSFALMWANRMPRRVLPVKNSKAQLINSQRLVHTDADDFLSFIKYVARNYFHRPNYFKLSGANYLSIFDTNFFLRQLGEQLATRAIVRVREWLAREGFGDLHLAAIDPKPEFATQLKQIGFDSVTHYVFLPEWKGERLQDFECAAALKRSLWSSYREMSGLEYFPSVSPGWDATPRAVDYGEEKPKRYPWSPIVVGRHPDKFSRILAQAIDFARTLESDPSLCLIASFNEWSEGHYLEPDTRYGLKWLRAVKKARGR